MSLTTKPGTGEARVLACLAKCSGEGLTIAQLCERLSRTPSTVRTSLRKLLLRGYQAETAKMCARNAVQRAAALESARKARERRRRAKDAV